MYKTIYSAGIWLLPHLMSYRWFMKWGGRGRKARNVYIISSIFRSVVCILSATTAGGGQTILTPPVFVCQRIKGPLWDARHGSFATDYWCNHTTIVFLYGDSVTNRFIGYHNAQNPFCQTLLTRNRWNIMVFNLRIFCTYIYIYT